MLNRYSVFFIQFIKIISNLLKLTNWFIMIYLSELNLLDTIRKYL